LLRDVRTISVIAHRGASEDVPEHTLAAYRKAIDDGADALECDVRLTRDGHLVCVHDRRVDRTSNGRGPVSDLELAELTALDWGSWREAMAELRAGDAVADLDLERRSLLTFERLCEVVADSGRRVELAVEAKHPTRHGARVERRLVELLRHFGWDRSRAGHPTPVRYMSFSAMAVRRVQALAPQVPTVLLFHRVPRRYRDGTPPLGVPVVGPSIAVLRSHPGYVAAARRRGAQVHVWTVDRTEDVRLATELGVDAIITNRPRKVLNLLGR
jgi:glycerophosphoryl diester phosphodiesterase